MENWQQMFPFYILRIGELFVFTRFEQDFKDLLLSFYTPD